MSYTVRYREATQEPYTAGAAFRVERREYLRLVEWHLGEFAQRAQDVCDNMRSREDVDQYALIQCIPVHATQTRDYSVFTLVTTSGTRTLILERAALFSFHHTRHSVTLCANNACSILRHWPKTSTSTRS